MNGPGILKIWPQIYAWIVLKCSNCDKMIWIDTSLHFTCCNPYTTVPLIKLLVVMTLLFLILIEKDVICNICFYFIPQRRKKYIHVHTCIYIIKCSSKGVVQNRHIKVKKGTSMCTTKGSMGTTPSRTYTMGTYDVLDALYDVHDGYIRLHSRSRFLYV